MYICYNCHKTDPQPNQDLKSQISKLGLTFQHMDITGLFLVTRECCHKKIMYLPPYTGRAEQIHHEHTFCVHFPASCQEYNVSGPVLYASGVQDTRLYATETWHECFTRQLVSKYITSSQRPWKIIDVRAYVCVCASMCTCVQVLWQLR